MRNALFIARNDVRRQLRQGGTLMWLLVLPPLFFFFIGTVTSGFGRSISNDVLRPMTVVAANPGALKDQITKRLAERGFEAAWVEALAESPEEERPSRILTLPPSFSDGLGGGTVQTVTYETDASELSRQYELVRINRALYTVLADVVAAGMRAGKKATAADIEALNAVPRLITLEVQSAGKRRKIPTGFEQAVPGILVMFVLFILLTTSAAQLVIERRQGLLRRLASAPMSRAEVVGGKWLGRLTLGAIQAAVALVFGLFFFKLNLGPDWPMVILLLAAWAAFCASAGLLMGSLVTTEGQAGGLGALVGNLLAALGGCWWPIEITPKWAQALQNFLPTGWAMDGFHKLATFQSGWISALPELSYLLIGALILGLISARRFRYVP